MRRLTITIILALSLVSIAPPAAAQETTTADGQNHDGIDTPAYQSPEEDEINARIAEADAEYARLEAEVARLEDELGPVSGAEEIGAVEDQMDDAEEEVRAGVEDLVATRLDLITDEEISGPPEQQRSQLQRADQALETLADYGGEWLPYESELPAAIDEAREGAAYQLAELEAAEDEEMERTGGEAVGEAPPEPESQPLSDGSDGGSDGGSDDIPGYNPGGFGALLSGITSGLAGIALTFGLIVGAMFAWAFRRERDAHVAWEQTATRNKLIIAAILAVLLGGLSIWTAVTLVIALAILAIPTALVIGWIFGRPGESKAETIARLIGGRELSPGSPPEEPPPPPPDGPDGPTVGGAGGRPGRPARREVRGWHGPSQEEGPAPKAEASRPGVPGASPGAGGHHAPQDCRPRGSGPGGIHRRPPEVCRGLWGREARVVPLYGADGCGQDGGGEHRRGRALWRPGPDDPLRHERVQAPRRYIEAHRSPCRVHRTRRREPSHRQDVRGSGAGNPLR